MGSCPYTQSHKVAPPSHQNFFPSSKTSISFNWVSEKILKESRGPGEWGVLWKSRSLNVLANDRINVPKSSMPSLGNFCHFHSFLFLSMFSQALQYYLGQHMSCVCCNFVSKRERKPLGRWEEFLFLGLIEIDCQLDLQEKITILASLF